MDAMGMSQPLHFGDYGGMPMKSSGRYWMG